MISITFGEDGNAMLEALYSAEDFGGNIARFKAYGGSGGQPDVDIQFPTREIAKTWLEEIYFYGDGDPEEIDDLLEYDDVKTVYVL